MTPEQQRIAIAEACGWTYNKVIQQWIAPGKAPIAGDRATYGLPNYLSDLNAMHEAEKVIKNTELWRQYKYELDLMPIDCIHATAAQRAEAFLRTLNLYTPCPT